MIIYRKPIPLSVLACGHHGTAGQVCQHRSHITPSGVVTLRRGESVTISRGTAR